MEIVMRPIAFVKNSRKDLSDDFWGSIISEIELAESVPSDAFNGINEFSHLEIIFYFDQTDKSKTVWKGHPRGNKQWPEVGIFAQRKKDRPNSIGLTVVELLERKGNTLTVRYLDAIDGTPIIDIKPVMKEFLPMTSVRQAPWSSELMKEYWH